MTRAFRWLKFSMAESTAACGVEMLREGIRIRRPRVAHRGSTCGDHGWHIRVPHVEALPGSYPPLHRHGPSTQRRIPMTALGVAFLGSSFLTRMLARTIPRASPALRTTGRALLCRDHSQSGTAQILRMPPPDLKMTHRLKRTPSTRTGPALLAVRRPLSGACPYSMLFIHMLDPGVYPGAHGPYYIAAVD